MNDNLKQILLEKESMLLADDFDDNMMLIISKHASSKVKERKYIRLMYLFFVLGLTFGFVIALTFVDLKFSLGSYMFTIHKLILQIPLIIVILLVFEKIYKASLVSMGKEKFTIT